MYSEKFQKSLAAVEAAREKNIALEPARMTAQQKTDLLAEYHPDYKQDEFDFLKIGHCLITLKNTLTITINNI